MIQDDPDFAEFDDLSLCECVDTRIASVLFVDGVPVDVEVFDTKDPEHDRKVDEAQVRQVKMSDQAASENKSWRIQVWCPVCLRGQWAQRTGRAKALHVLMRHQGDHEPTIEAACGHTCFATANTWTLLQSETQFNNTTVCIECYTADKEAWISGQRPG